MMARGRFVVLCLVVACSVTVGASAAVNASRVERWGIFELTLEGPRDGDPFLDVSLSARFTHGDNASEPKEPRGFYDGNGVYRVRFMPDALGTWRYVTKSDRPELHGRTGRFLCVKPSAGNHGPVRVRKTWHFAYADGTPYFQVGTTCYTWVHREKELEEQTLATLKNAPFNKIRFGVFPNHYGRPASSPEPVMYPFEGKPRRDWDFTRFNPEYFRHFERRVGDLRDLGIEADVILFHPYDRWGFAKMGAENDDRYLRYVIARLAAYRNVWWSMANEFDLVRSKNDADWDRFFQITRDEDPYGHPRSNHNCRRWYDHTKPWVTHCSVQSADFRAGRQWRQKYRKPIIYDECRYEGDPEGPGWGRLSGREMTRHFWLGTVAGCYVGHSEIKLHPEDLVWVTRGNVLRGESPPRIAFFRKIMEEGPPFEDMEPLGVPGAAGAIAIPGQYYLVYFDRPGQATLTLTGTRPGRVDNVARTTRPYRVDGIDTWNMTVTPVDNAVPGEFTFTAPQPDYALRFSIYSPGEKLRPAPARIQWFSASTSIVARGKPATLSWKAVNATSVTLDGTPVEAEGSKSVSPRKTTAYTLTVDGEGGAKSREVSVSVIDPDALHLRFDCGTDTPAPGWMAVRDFVTGGSDYSDLPAVETTGVANAAVYKTCRHFGHSYDFPSSLVPDGKYLVRLHLNDNKATRAMAWTIEGVEVLKGFDPPARTATVKEFKVTVSGGLQIEAVGTGKWKDVFECGIEIVGARGRP